MYLFYCPNCKYEVMANKVPYGAVANARDGWGHALYHYECPDCGNLDAAYVHCTDDKNDKAYYKHVISMYQGIRGFKK